MDKSYICGNKLNKWVGDVINQVGLAQIEKSNPPDFRLGGLVAAEAYYEVADKIDPLSCV